MTTEEFFNELSSYKGEFKNKDGIIRHKDYDSCPICFLVKEKYNTTCPNYLYMSAGIDLNLSMGDILDIVDSADGRSAKYRKVLLELCQ